MGEQRYQAIVERVNSLLALTRSLAWEPARQRTDQKPDLDQLKSEAARLAADIDAARHDLGAATGDQPRRTRPTGVGAPAGWPPVGTAVRDHPAVPGYWFG